jgi:hypothetical protein
MIGRKEKSDIEILNEGGFSREQTSIYYDHNENCWFLKDGGKEPSKSGTWYIYIFKLIKALC